jgi:hypothetical protein
MLEKSIPMKDVSQLRELESNCRQWALSEPERKWHWLAQAAKYHTQADCEICDEFPDAPEVRLASWLGEDAKRLQCR